MSFTAKILRGINADKSSDSWKVFQDIFNVRFLGYYKHYGDKLMPFDIYDYISDHIIIYKSTNSHEHPVSSIRCISNDTCLRNDLEFLPIKRTVASNDVLSNAILKECKISHNVCYDSGFTVEASITNLREIYDIINLTIGVALNYHQQQSHCKIFASTIKTTKTDKIFSKIGFEPVISNSKYILSGFEDHEFHMTKFDKYNNTAEKVVHESRSLWDNIKYYD